MPDTSSGIVIDLGATGVPHGIRSRLGKPYSGDYQWLGIAAGISDTNMKYLSGLSKGTDRISFVRNNSQILEDPSYMFYNEDLNIATVPHLNGTPYTDQKISAICDNLPKNAWIVAGLDLDRPDMGPSLQALQENGFDSWFTTKAHPLQLDMDDSQVWGGKSNGTRLVRSNIPAEPTAFLINETDYACQIVVSLDKDAVKRLREYVYTSNGKRDGSGLQREIAGKLHPVYCNKDRCILGFDSKSIITGASEEVPIAGGVYNFHTHPADAYWKNGLRIAHPSNQDYVGLLAAVHEYNTILHLVLAQEGVYFISLAEDFIPFVDKMDDDFVDEILDTFPGCINSHLPNKTDMLDVISRYIDIINNKKCMGMTIFKVVFKTWENATEPIVVTFSKLKCGTCIADQESLDHFRALNGRESTDLFGRDHFESDEGNTEYDD